MARHPRWVLRILTAVELDELARAIADAEAHTSGEIRIHLDAVCSDDAVTRAKAVFERLEMHRTTRRNGVLIYVAVEDRKFAVIGDEAVHTRVGQAYWEGLARTLGSELAAGRARDGLFAAVQDVGHVLRVHFPRDRDDRDELRDEVSISP